MSFVGPRPLLVEYLECYSPQQARRHEVKAGITGWAQINDRNAISRQEKFNRDVWHFAYWSLWLDFKILLLTPIKVIKHRDISHADQATMNEFSGNIKSNE
jgi:lipopolysaccharide/colanic/teichoic acid biosynthesis glycosyltransferase